MPLIDEAVLLRDLRRPAESAGAPAAEPAARGAGPGPGVLGAELCLPEILGRRRSVRAFSAEPTQAGDLALAAGAGLAAARGMWPAGARRMRLTLVLAALNVDGLAPGLYLATAPGAFSLAEAEPAWLPELRVRYATAPAMLMACGDISGPARHDYRQALVLAAAAGHAAWLRAVSLGLAGTVFGGTCHQVTASLAEAGLPRLWHLFTLAAGWPGRDGEERSRRD